MSGGGGPTKTQRALEQRQLARERELTVDRQRAAARAFTDQIAFRRKLRGMWSLLSNGFKGFPGGAQSQSPTVAINPTPSPEAPPPRVQ
jgi:hypothetical protein